MDFMRLSTKDFAELKRLHIAYKAEIGENPPTNENWDGLFQAILDEKILFFGCRAEGALVACCSISPVFSTFDYRRGGALEDFYILPEYRHQGIARRLIAFAHENSGVSSLTVGCADCDAAMYRALGFTVPLGNLLAYSR